MCSKQYLLLTLNQAMATRSIRLGTMKNICVCTISFCVSTLTMCLVALHLIQRFTKFKIIKYNPRKATVHIWTTKNGRIQFLELEFVNYWGLYLHNLLHLFSTQTLQQPGPCMNFLLHPTQSWPSPSNLLLLLLPFCLLLLPSIL